MTDLWPLLEGLLSQAERPVRYINHEWGSTVKDEADYHFCMVYPDTYELGQANQAVRLLCNAINARAGLSAQRSYLPAPAFCDVLRENDVPLFSLEQCNPLSEFDAIGITLPHELAATNVLEVLDLARIPLVSLDRSDTDPLIVGGGPCAFNPEPYAPFFDVISIGEGEEALPELLERHRELRKQGLSRRALLVELAHIPGVYVPSLYDVVREEEAQTTTSWIKPQCEGLPTTITKRIYEGFAQSPAWEPCVVPFAEVVHDRLNVEVLRGCTRGCRFCQAGMMYRPVRERSAKNIIDSIAIGLAETGYDEVSLTSLSTTDHSQIAPILTTLNERFEGKGIRVSIPSQRLDSFGVDMAGLVAGQKKGGLTFAPEAGTQRLRDVINKNVSEDDLMQAVDAAFSEGWRRCKLYFMVGLPTETDEDLRGIAHLADKVYERAREILPKDQRGHIRISVSCALFVPKAQTPFQWDGQISAEEAKRRVQLVRSSLSYRAIDLTWHDPSTSLIEAVMSRGGRDCAQWVLHAWKKGARFDAWSEHFNEQAWDEAAEELKLDPQSIANKEYPLDYVMPWSHISTGVSSEFLKQERERAAQGVTTEDCTFDSCTDCGVCFELDATIETEEVRHG